MYKNISFQEAEFGEKKFLMYRVDDAAQMDHVEVEMLKNNDIKDFFLFLLHKIMMKLSLCMKRQIR